jgi:hypothetical protein
MRSRSTDPELRTLSVHVSAAMAKSADRETRTHLQGVRDPIARIPDPKFNQGGNAAVPAARLGIDGFVLPDGTQPDVCWPGYVILP